MTRAVDIDDLDPALAELVVRAMLGDDVVVERAGTPLVRLVRVQPVGPRGLGILKGLIGPEPEGIFDPLTEEELADWE